MRFPSARFGLRMSMTLLQVPRSGCHQGRTRAAGDVSASALPATSDQCTVSGAALLLVYASMARWIAHMQPSPNGTGISQCWAVTRGGNDEASGPRSSSRSCAALTATEFARTSKPNATTTSPGTPDSASM